LSTVLIKKNSPNNYYLIYNYKRKNVKFQKNIFKEKTNDGLENYDANYQTETNNKESLENLKENKNLISFWKEISEEIKMVEWPTLDRLLKQFVIVIISLVFSAFIIYSVDGLFAWVSKFLFEGKF
jgi:preprotein translocase SecE subunit